MPPRCFAHTFMHIDAQLKREQQVQTAAEEAAGGRYRVGSSRKRKVAPPPVVQPGMPGWSPLMVLSYILEYQYSIKYVIHVHVQPLRINHTFSAASKKSEVVGPFCAEVREGEGRIFRTVVVDQAYTRSVWQYVMGVCE